MTRVTRRYRFSASHRLHAAQLTAAENERLYGKCNNPHGHGHDYVIEITMIGPIDERTGQAGSVEALDRLVRECVVQPFAHCNFNLDVEAFRERVPTSENILAEIRSRLAARWIASFPGEWPRLERLRLEETRRNSFEIAS